MLGSEDLFLVRHFLFKEYAEIIVQVIAEKNSQHIKLESFEDVVDGNAFLEDFYRTLNGLEQKIKDLLIKKIDIQQTIQTFVIQILKGFKIAADKSLGDIKLKIQEELGIKKTVVVFNKLLYNEEYPVKNLPSLTKHLLFDIEIVDIFLQLNNKFLETNTFARDVKNYFITSLNATIMNVDRMSRISNEGSMNNNNNVSDGMSYNPRHFAASRKATVLDEFPLSGVLNFQDVRKFEMAIIKENAVTTNTLLQLILRDETTLAQVKELISNNRRVLQERDRFGNNPVHLVAMGSNKEAVDIIKFLSTKDTNLSNQANNYGLTPFYHALIFRKMEDVSLYYINSKHPSVQQKAPMDIGFDTFIPRKGI